MTDQERYKRAKDILIIFKDDETSFRHEILDGDGMSGLESVERFMTILPRLEPHFKFKTFFCHHWQVLFFKTSKEVEEMLKAFLELKCNITLPMALVFDLEADNWQKEMDTTCDIHVESAAIQ